MTSASELFFIRRSRFCRNDNVDLGFESFDRISHYHPNRRQRSSQRHEQLGGCIPLRRSPQPRRPIHRPSFSERGSIPASQGSAHSTVQDIINSENISFLPDGTRFRRNDSLPGAVLLARERLIQRLRGVYLSGNRNNRPPSGVNHDDFVSFGNERLVDAGDWETERPGELLSRGTPFPDYNSQTELLLNKRPEGLSQEALDGLDVEVFKGDEGFTSRSSQDCSVCLENFTEGDELIRLQCWHRFHSACLDPWIRTCGDCPFCRTEIDTKTHRAEKNH